jgi:hypothetical protein
VDDAQNALTVTRGDGRSVNYDPRQSEQAGERLVNQRLAYLARSRGRHDAQIN